MSKKEILIIDDEQMILDMLDQILSAAGYDVQTALGGKKALEIFAAHPVGLVLTDIKMPGIDGYHLLREIKGQKPDTRIVLMSGYSNDLSIREAIELGADEFVVKPFKGSEILQVLESAME
jgi:YesN/AraC family two-component response regulator